MGTLPNSPRSSRPAALFLLSAAWIVLSLSVGRGLSGLAPAVWQDFTRLLFSAAILFAGFYYFARTWVPDLRPLSSVGFVRRPGIATEFGVGAALGWAISLAFVLPAVLSGNLSSTFAWDTTAVFRFFLSAASLLAFAFVVQLILSGLPSRLLVRAIGPGWTTAAVIFVASCLIVPRASGDGSSLLFIALSAALFCTAFLRTRAIWLPLGLQIGWTLSLQLLFGAASPYQPPTYGIVQSDIGGPAWLTGGPFGPEASAVAIIVLIAALVALVRVTRDYAWNYTYQPIEGAGVAVVIAPPAEHLREEEKAAAKAVPLVQIGGISLPPTPPDPSL